MAVASAPLEVDAAAYGRQVAELQRLDVLRDVPESELLLLLDRLVFRAFAPGATFNAERGLSSCCYFIVHGTLWTKLQVSDDNEALLDALGRGDCFGIGPLFGFRDPCTAAYAETSCYVLQIKLEALQNLLPRLPALSRALRRHYRRLLAQTTLARAPLFGRLSPAVRQSIIENLVHVQADRNIEVLRQGDSGEAFYIIELGQLAVEQNDAVVAHLSGGDFFGEISLLQAQPHTATVRTLTPTDLLKLPAVDFARLLSEQPELQRQVQEVSALRLQESAAIQSDDKRAAELETVVQHGLMRGAYLLVRRPSLCPPGCRICEEACSSRFGRPRMQLNGVAAGAYDVPATCRQCQVGAECVEACPEDAITWDGSGALVINDRCNGCGQCLPACPYDAVELVEQSRSSAARHTAPRVLQMWEHIFARREPREIKLVADKCDLCHGYSDKACLSQCPTGSLQLVPVDSLFSQ